MFVEALQKRPPLVMVRSLYFDMGMTVCPFRLPGVFPLQVLAADVSDANREACASTTRPLVDAVDALVTFASSPQFASTPAKISAQARLAQEPILQSGRNVIKSSPQPRTWPSIPTTSTCGSFWRSTRRPSVIRSRRC